MSYKVFSKDKGCSEDEVGGKDEGHDEDDRCRTRFPELARGACGFGDVGNERRTFNVEWEGTQALPAPRGEARPTRFVAKMRGGVEKVSYGRPNRVKKKIMHPPRIVPFQKYDRPLWFITFGTHNRKPVLASREVCNRLKLFGEGQITRGIAIGLYVVMPDHIHLFVRLTGDCKLVRQSVL